MWINGPPKIETDSWIGLTRPIGLSRASAGHGSCRPFVACWGYRYTRGLINWVKSKSKSLKYPRLNVNGSSKDQRSRLVYCYITCGEARDQSSTKATLQGWAAHVTWSRIPVRTKLLTLLNTGDGWFSIDGSTNASNSMANKPLRINSMIRLSQPRHDRAVYNGFQI